MKKLELDNVLRGNDHVPIQNRNKHCETQQYEIKKFKKLQSERGIPQSRTDPQVAYHFIENMLASDICKSSNMGTFVNSGSDEWATRLAVNHIGKNFIDREGCSSIFLAEKRTVHMIADWFGTHFDEADQDPDQSKGFYGCSTVGSSEAIFLALIAHRKNWQKNNKKNPNAGEYDKPFIVVSRHVHTCWDKFCRYFEIGSLYLPMRDDKFAVTGDDVLNVIEPSVGDSEYRADIYKVTGAPDGSLDHRNVGEFVMAVAAVIGTTFTGNTDNALSISESLDVFCSKLDHLNVDIPIHVDAALGGFIVPFTNQLVSNNRDIKQFDFKHVPRVQSINVSNHKFGLTYPGMGTIVFRDGTVVDSSLIYEINYLGGSFFNFTLNFSKDSIAVLSGYYNFIKLGIEGYKEVIVRCLRNGKWFMDRVRSSKTLSPQFEPINDAHHFPMVCVFKAAFDQSGSWIKNISINLKKRGWLVPVYQLPTTSEQGTTGLWVARFVIRNEHNREKLDQLITDWEAAVVSGK